MRTATRLAVTPAERAAPRTATAAVWRRLLRNRTAVAGMVVLVLFALSGILAPWLAPHDPYRSDLEGSLAPPSGKHWLGTDELGRDILSRVIYGARLSMVIGTIAVSIGVAIGVPVGLFAGYFGGRFDLLSQRVIDVLLGFPSIILAIVLVTVLGVGLVNVMIAVGIVSVPTYARLVRGQVLSLKTQEFVEAARALGAGNARIVFRLIFPGLAIMLTVLGFNLLGDGLRDALDPRMRL
jgi:ABC-type dipeptide/oligopeptide/nickel transport system permease subunit